MKHDPAPVKLTVCCRTLFQRSSGTALPRLGLWPSAVRDAYVTLLPMTIVGRSR
jgi:hypothetical protein